MKSWFFRLNRRLCRRLDQILPHRRNLYEDYQVAIRSALSTQPNQVLIDVGGGKTCPFRGVGIGTTLVAVDVSHDELFENKDVHARMVADVVEGLPIASEKADLIVSTSVLEHLIDVDRFVAQARVALRPGGRFVHLFPGRYSSFAVINRLLGPRLSKRVLFFFKPEARGTCGFRAYYDRTYDSAMRLTLDRNGFEVEEIRVNYYGSGYYDFFFPAYVLSVVYELIVYFLKRTDLAAHYLVVARKT